jgi:hypothetical protein
MWSIRFKTIAMREEKITKKHTTAFAWKLFNEIMIQPFWSGCITTVVCSGQWETLDTVNPHS